MTPEKDRLDNLPAERARPRHETSHAFTSIGGIVVSMRLGASDRRGIFCILAGRRQIHSTAA